VAYLFPDLDLTIVGLLEVLWMILVVGMLLWQDRTPVATLAWILALGLLPGVGLVVYLFFGPRRLRRKRNRRALARSIVHSGEGASWVRQSREAIIKGAFEGNIGSELALLAVRSGEPPPFRCDSVDLYFRGSECFDAIIAAIGEATHHVHLLYYIFDEGTVATRLRDVLVAKARAGVEVRLLVDGLGSRGLADAFLRPLVDAGGEVAIFNPVAFANFRPSLVNFRTHRKIVCCDGVVGFTGGMNIEDGHDDSIVGDMAWRDTHVRIVGDAVAGLELVFLEDWTFAHGHAPSGARYVVPPSGKGKYLAQIVASGPDLDATFAIHGQYFAAIAGANERVYLSSAYFVPDEPMIVALSTAARRGVDVRILVPRAGDHPFVDAAARSFCPALVRAGVRIFGYGPNVFHAKTLVVDRHYAAIGSANFDNRSFRLNFELTAAILDAEVADRLADAFVDDLRHATEFTRSTVARESRMRRLFAAFAKLFSPIL